MNPAMYPSLSNNIPHRENAAQVNSATDTKGSSLTSSASCTLHNLKSAPFLLALFVMMLLTPLIAAVVYSDGKELMILR